MEERKQRIAGIAKSGVLASDAVSPAVQARVWQRAERLVDRVGALRSRDTLFEDRMVVVVRETDVAGGGVRTNRAVGDAVETSWKVGPMPR